MNRLGSWLGGHVRRQYFWGIVAILILLAINVIKDPTYLAIRVNPVTFPPGLTRLLTSPAFTGSPAMAITMGTVWVARLAASAATLLSVTMTSTLRRTSSPARAGSLSAPPAASRCSR